MVNVHLQFPTSKQFNDSNMDIEGGSFEKSQKHNKNSSQSGTNINTNGKKLKLKHRNSEHSKVEGKNINLKGHSLKRKHTDNEQSKFGTTNKKLKESLSLTRNHKHGKFNEPNMNLTGNSLESKPKEKEHRTVDEKIVKLKGDSNKRKRKHDKHDKGKKKVKKSKREHVTSGILISSDNDSGGDIPGEANRKSSNLSKSQGAKSASSVIHEPGLQDSSSASHSESDLMKTVNHKAEGKCVNDVHINNYSVSLSDMKQESDVLSYQKPRDYEYSSQNPEEKLFFTILNKYATTNGTKNAKTKEELKQSNVFHLLQRGKWRQSEVMQLKLNMDYFKETYPSCDPGTFLYCYKYPSQRKGQERLEYRKLRRCFMRCLGYKIKRNLHNVFTKAVLFFFQGRTGKFSSSEVELIRKHGDMKSSHRFAMLAPKLDRHYWNIRWAYKNRGSELRQSGPWTSKEDKILLKAVKTALVQLGGDIVKGLPWTEISKSVQTRPPYACQARYLNTLRWREMHQSTFKPPVSTADKIRLIEMICESNVQEEVEIDWHSLLKDFPGVSSHTPLQQLWHRLKIKVPDYFCKNLDEITDHLAKFEIPKLQRKLEKQLQSVEDKSKVLKMQDNDL